MPDGSVIKGAQGNFPFEKSKAWSFRLSSAAPEQRSAKESALRRLDGGLFAVPWISPDPLDALKALSFTQLLSAHAAIPSEVMARHEVNLSLPVPTPDLIGVEGRHYLDRTGLQKQRSIADLMRYAALNQGADDLASYGGFVPAEFLYSTTAPDPADPIAVGGRYSDEQLYALALYLYALQPPPNPNRMDSVAARGKKIFESNGCAGCHTPPLYTNNKLTPANGFRVPEDAPAILDVLPNPVGTDPNLTMRTRRGTGYYKVPSIRGVWYRSMFGHNGWCATLEDWFDPISDWIQNGGEKPRAFSDRCLRE
jgi:mono/diheme cytochrome c family protein